MLNCRNKHIKAAKKTPILDYHDVNMHLDEPYKTITEHYLSGAVFEVLNLTSLVWDLKECRFKIFETKSTSGIITASLSYVSDLLSNASL